MIKCETGDCTAEATTLGMCERCLGQYFTFQTLCTRLSDLGIIERRSNESTELIILCKGGITEDDLEFALDKLEKSARNPHADVWSEWGFLRAVMISHHAVVRKAQAAVTL